MYFCKIEYFAYEEITQRSFSNPQPVQSESYTFWKVAMQSISTSIQSTTSGPFY